MNRKNYRKIAQKYGVSIKDVKRDMQEAIDETYKNPGFHARCICCKGEKPTIDEFINYLSHRIKSENTK